MPESSLSSSLSTVTPKRPRQLRSMYTCLHSSFLLMFHRNRSSTALIIPHNFVPIYASLNPQWYIPSSHPRHLQPSFNSRQPLFPIPNQAHHIRKHEIRLRDLYRNPRLQPLQSNRNPCNTRLDPQPPQPMRQITLIVPLRSIKAPLQILLPSLMSRHQERAFVRFEIPDQVLHCVVDHFRRPALEVQAVGFRFRGLAPSLPLQVLALLVQSLPQRGESILHLSRGRADGLEGVPEGVQPVEML